MLVLLDASSTSVRADAASDLDDCLQESQHGDLDVAIALCTKALQSQLSDLDRATARGLLESLQSEKRYSESKWKYYDLMIIDPTSRERQGPHAPEHLMDETMVIDPSKSRPGIGFR